MSDSDPKLSEEVKNASEFLQNQPLLNALSLAQCEWCEFCNEFVGQTNPDTKVEAQKFVQKYRNHCTQVERLKLESLEAEGKCQSPALKQQLKSNRIVLRGNIMDVYDMLMLTHKWGKEPSRLFSEAVWKLLLETETETTKKST
jgi:hypothetical protein